MYTYGVSTTKTTVLFITFSVLFMQGNKNYYTVVNVHYYEFFQDIAVIQ